MYQAICLQVFEMNGMLMLQTNNYLSSLLHLSVKEVVLIISNTNMFKNGLQNLLNVIEIQTKEPQEW